MDVVSNRAQRERLTALLHDCLHCGELIALETTDIDLKRGVLRVRQSEWEGHVTSPKSGRGRTVVLTERLKQALATNRHLHGERVLWRDDEYEKVTQVLLAKWMRRLQRRAGLEVNRPGFPGGSNC
jgi:integrase